MQLELKDHGNKLQQQQLLITVALEQDKVMDKRYFRCQRYLLVLVDKNLWFDKTNYFSFRSV